MGLENFLLCMDSCKKILNYKLIFANESEAQSEHNKARQELLTELNNL